MALVHYPDELPMIEARLLYFRANGFGDDGGYSKKIEWVKLGPLPIPVFNPPARVRALRFHDMHHVLTGYDTNWAGEFEIAGWELAQGCGDVWVAWLLNLGIVALGILVMPRRVARAFLRGRHSRNLYREGHRDLEHQSVADLRALAGLDRPTGAWRPRDLAWFAWILALATVWGLLQLALALAPLVALIALVRWLLA